MRAAENVLDHRLNCRTVYMNAFNRYMYWNMNYHLEHHMFPLVPYHNLPKLTNHQSRLPKRRTACSTPGGDHSRRSPANKDPAYYISGTAQPPRDAPPATHVLQPRENPSAAGRNLRDGLKDVLASTTRAKPMPSIAPDGSLRRRRLHAQRARWPGCFRHDHHAQA
jgi:hypothetical protein